MVDTDPDRKFQKEGARLDTNRTVFEEISKMLDTKSGQACEKNDRLDTNRTHMVNFYVYFSNASNKKLGLMWPLMVHRKKIFGPELG